jgi:hypothetical protein
MEAPPENFAYTLLLSGANPTPRGRRREAWVADLQQCVHTVTMPNKGDEFTILAGTPVHQHCHRSPAMHS